LVTLVKKEKRRYKDRDEKTDVRKESGTKGDEIPKRKKKKYYEAIHGT